MFDPNLVLQANTLYYFYSDTSFENSGSGNDPYAGGDVFAAYGPNDTFGLLKYGDADFRMSGSRVSNFAAVPEPSEYAAMGMLGATLLFGTVRARRKKAA